MNAANVLSNPSTWLVWVVLLIICAAYAAFVRWLRESNEGGSQTAWLVVAGNTLVMLAATVVVALATDIETAIVVFFVMFLSNVFGGIPMIVEYVMWYHNRSRKQARTEQQRRISDTLRGE